MSGEVYFRDREHAGRLLAERLAHLAGEEPVVLGLVRGGVVVAAEVARKLQAPLDVIVTRKLGAPFQPELAIGAVARDASFVDDDLVRALGISPHQVAEITAAAMREVERYEHKFRGGRPPERIEGRTAIVVDDGLATGATVMAAVRALRHQKPRRTVVGLPTCASDAARRLAVEVDEVACLTEPIDFHAVGQWYENFTQVEDEEVEQPRSGSRSCRGRGICSRSPVPSVGWQSSRAPGLSSILRRQPPVHRTLPHPELPEPGAMGPRHLALRCRQDLGREVCMLDASCVHCATPITDRSTEVELNGKTFCCRNCVVMSAGTRTLPPDTPTCAHCRLSIVDTSTLVRRGALTFCCTNCAAAMSTGVERART